MLLNVLTALLGGLTLASSATVPDHGPPLPRPMFVPLFHSRGDHQYHARVTFGHNQTLPLVVDTTSSDVTVVAPHIKCFSRKPHSLPLKRTEVFPCGVKPHNGIFDLPLLSAGYRKGNDVESVPDQRFYQPKRIGTYEGSLARDKITFGGLGLIRRIFGTIELYQAPHDRQHGKRFMELPAGYLGLGLPDAIEVAGKPGERIPSNWDTNPERTHGTLIEEMALRHSTGTLFTLNFGEDHWTSHGAQGWFALAGERVITAMSKHWIHAPVPLKRTEHPTDRAGWEFVIDGLKVSNHTAVSVANDTRGVIDSTIPYSILPAKYANAIAASFHPPGKKSLRGGLIKYAVKCNAKAPKFAIRVSGKEIHFNANTLKHVSGKGTTCSMSIKGQYAEKENDWILGTNFLRNVITMFDMANSELRFAPKGHNSTVHG